jgi:hypothetical protein
MACDTDAGIKIVERKNDPHQGYSNEERLIFFRGAFLFPSRLTIAVNAFTSTFSPDVRGELILTSKGDCEMQCI